MKKNTLVAIALAFTVQSAFAEDEATQPPSPWNGSHVGLDGGYAWDPVIAVSAVPAFAGIDNQQLAFPNGFYPGITHSGASALSASGTVSPNVGGFIGGVEFGYDHHIGNSIVVGAEADFQGAMVRGRQGFRNAAQTLFFDTGSCFAPVGCTNTAVSFVDSAKSIDWFGTLRGRLGYLATPTLLAYMTGGLAYGGVTASSSIAQVWQTGYALTSPGASGRFNGARVGWTVGGGLEWLFAPAWSAKVEYLYYDLGSANFSSGPLVTAFPVGTFPCCIGEPTVYNVVMPRTHTRFYGDMVRAGVNYHFDLFQASAPIVSQALIQRPKEF